MPRNPGLSEERSKMDTERGLFKKTMYLNVMAILFFCLAWQLASFLSKSTLFPGPLAVAKAFYRMAIWGDMQQNRLWYHAYVSIQRVLAGLCLSCLIAIPL